MNATFRIIDASPRRRPNRTLVSRPAIFEREKSEVEWRTAISLRQSSCELSRAISIPLPVKGSMNADASPTEKRFAAAMSRQYVRTLHTETASHSVSGIIICHRRGRSPIAEKFVIYHFHRVAAVLADSFRPHEITEIREAVLDEVDARVTVPKKVDLARTRMQAWCR